jgi:hypothetical protein
MTSSGDEPFTVGGATRIDLRPFHVACVDYAQYALEPLRGDQEASQSAYQRFIAWTERYKHGLRNKAGQTLSFVRHYLRDASRRPGDDGDPRVARQWP